MAKYIVNPDGSIETETPEAALALSRLLVGARPKAHEAHEDAGRSAGKREPPKPAAEEPAHEESPPPSTNGAAWAKFVGLLKDNQRATLRTIKANDNITLTELVQKLGAEQTSSVAGYLTGIVRNADKCGIKLADIYRRSEQGWGPKRVVRYRPGSLLRSHDVPE